MSIAEIVEQPRSPIGRVPTTPPVPLHVLVAEDSVEDQRLLRSVLERLGYVVDLVRDGLQAVAAVTAGPDRFAAVLMDCRMPRMDGYEATQVIRELEPSGAHVPVIAMCAPTRPGERAYCLMCGMDDVVFKPLVEDRLASTLLRTVRLPALVIPPG